MNQTQILITIVVLAVIVVVIAVILNSRKLRSRKLRERFGPEYDRTVRREGDVRKAEGLLEFREQRRQKFTVRPIPAAEKAGFESRWADLQSQFVDDPKRAVGVADALITEVMQVRGYPMGDFEQRAADISTDYPVVVENYRLAHEIALRHNRGQASTEDLRRAMVHYRTLFQELLDQPQPQRKGA